MLTGRLLAASNLNLNDAGEPESNLWLEDRHKFIDVRGCVRRELYCELALRSSASEIVTTEEAEEKRGRRPGWAPTRVQEQERQDSSFIYL
jgi:hypothetical protein